MKVLFTHGYFLQDDPKEQAIMKPYPPLGLLYLSAWLDKYQIENEVFDTTFSNMSKLESCLLETSPPIVALYTNLMTKLNVLEIVRFIRMQPALQNTLVVLGGPDVTHNATNYLKCGADLIVMGEGEQTMLEIALSATDFRKPFNDNKLWDASGIHSCFHSISGLAYLYPEGKLQQTSPREKMRDIDQLPLPNRHKINLENYLQAWKKAHGHSAVSISTQRGCPYTCNWCSTAVYGQSYRRRSPENVVDEIEHLQKEYDFELVWFVDDVFTVSHKWLLEFKEVLFARKINLKFECITRADRLNPEVLKMLRECGCFRVWIGAESGSQRIIDAMDRRVDVNQVREMIRAARVEGIQAGTFIMLGYPGETEQDIFETVRHLKESGPDLFTITLAYPIKGTGLYEAVESRAFFNLAWEHSTDRDIDFKRTYPRAYYDFALRWTVSAVSLHKLRKNGNILGLQGLKLLAKTGLARLGMAIFK
jgi:radical SAM superfamily enzyme YgiQ (UPF0313 family)